MLDNPFMIEVARLGMACSFIQLNDPAVEIDDHELFTRRVG